MNRPRIDFDAFRALRERTRRWRADEASPSRRDFLKLFGVAALGFAPAPERLAAATLSAPLTVTRGRRRVVFAFGDQVAWIIDADRFGGSPRIELGETRARIDLRLRGATIPGSDLAADLDARLERRGAGWRIELTLPGFGFSAQGDFARWTTGAERLAAVPGGIATGRLGDHSRLTLGGSGEAVFFPDWRLELEDVPIAVSVGGVDLEARRGIVAIAPAHGGLLAEPRRAVVTLVAAGRPLRLDPLLPDPRPASFAGAAAFDTVTIESGEDHAGIRRAALYAEGEDGGLAYRPHPVFQGAGGGPFELPLTRIGLAALIDGGESALIADFADDVSPLAWRGMVVEVGGGAGAAPFELASRGGEITRRCCEPALIGVGASMPDALAAPLRADAGTRLAFIDDFALAAHAGQTAPLTLPRAVLTPRTASEPTGDGGDDPGDSPTIAPVAPATLPLRRLTPGLTIPAPTPSSPVAPGATAPASPTRKPPPAPAPAAPTLRPSLPGVAAPSAVPGVLRPRLPGTLVLPAFRVEVVRPEDFLHLVFAFDNLRLDAGDGSTALVPIAAGKPATITVEFPPQNIHEEALYEDESGGDPAKAPPVRSRIAGASRLVFQVPADVTRIEYRLGALLEAIGAFPLKVSRNALPPPARPLLRLPIQVGRAALMTRFTNLAPAPAPDLGGATARTRTTTTAALTRAAPAPEVTRQPPGATPGSMMFHQWQPLRLQPGVLQALPTGPEPNVPPAPSETVIEAPYRLYLSPHRDAAFAHSPVPVVGHYGRVELWHTRLAVRAAGGAIDERDDYNRTLRAVWSPDYNPAAIPPAGAGPFRGSLDARDRHEIVALTSDFRIPGYVPQPVWAKRLMLTSLGAWMDTRGAWEPPCDPKGRSAPTGTAAGGVVMRLARPLLRQDPCPPGTSGTCPGEWLSVEEWRHRATMGRDHYVRVVYKGYLFPFGHRASLVKVTERKFRPIDQGPSRGRIAAYLHQRMFIVVREPELFYPEGHRKNPFRALRITTLVTPNLDKPEQSDIDNQNRRAFWPTVAGRPFEFHMVGVDWRGQLSDFTAPVIFLDQGLAKDPGFVKNAARGAYRAEQNLERRRRRFGGQEVAFAEVLPAEPAATTLAASSIDFDAGVIESCAPGDLPMFFPEVSEARVRIPAVEALTGGRDTVIRIAPHYLANAFAGANAGGQVFAEVLGATPMTYSADTAGGIATPNINIAGLSRTNGPVGGAPGSGGDGPDLGDFAGGVFKPEKYFEGAALDAMILGGIRLFELFAPELGREHAPRLVNTPVYRDDELVAIETRLTWEPPVDPRVPVFRRNMGGNTRFRIEARIVKSLKGGDSQSSFSGVLTNFAIDLLPPIQSFIEIEFESFEFVSVSGGKPDITPKIRDVRFKGALAYVAELAKHLSTAGGGGLAIDVTPAGVSAGFDLAIPAVTSGVMNLQNIAFSAGLTLPFSGDPMRARFAFCERDNPFLLTVYCFGGGGFASLSVGLDGVEQLELAFEFGASCSLDIGVASGGVEIMAGIYINVVESGSLLSGYLRMGGQLSVLGIVRVSVEFYMALSHDSATNKTWGECKLTVEIEILFFSASVSMHVRREFSEPTRLPFRDMMTRDDWAAYCDAFA